jgi:hypothetical protein
MAGFALSRQPAPIVVLDIDGCIDAKTLEEALDGRDDVSLCIRSTEGPEARGGYYFSLRKEAPDQYMLRTFDLEDIVLMSQEKLIELINHASGRKFSAEMLVFSQRVINLRVDS